MSIIRILFPLLFLLPVSILHAQLPPACGGGSLPAIACESACINCNFDGFTGSTIGFPSVPAVDFCGTVENAQWLGFIAGSTTATFTITPFNCSDGNGVQVALYQDCTAAPLACDKGQKDGDNIPVSISMQLSPGTSYFLMIDGYAGDQCEFTVDVTPKEAVYEPALGVVGEISGPVEACPGATFTYTVQPVAGAGAYIWDGPPGTLVDSMPVPVVGKRTVQITLGDQSGNICVQAANACEVNPPCTSSLFVEILGDDARPVISGDTVAHLTCLGTPLLLQPDITPPGSYGYQWTADSTGQIVSGGDSPRPRVSAIGLYTLLVNNPVNGCTSEGSIRVEEPELPAAEVLILRDISCYGFADGIARVGEIKTGTPPYLYSLDGAPLAIQPEFRFLEPGVHHILVQDAAGCTWDTMFTLVQPDELMVWLPEDTVLHLGQTVQLWAPGMVNFPDRAQEVQVEPAYLAAFLCDTCRFCPQNSFRYRVSVTDSAGCRAEDERQVAVTKERHVYIPNAFKPDAQGDGNEFFRVFGGEDVALVRQLLVFNRWGQAVHQRADFAPGALDGAWDGRLQGELLPSGVYLYVAEIEFKDGVVEVYKGDVVLIR